MNDKQLEGLDKVNGGSDGFEWPNGWDVSQEKPVGWPNGWDVSQEKPVGWPNGWDVSQAKP